LARPFRFEHLADRASTAPGWLRYLASLTLVLIDSLVRAMLVPTSAGTFRLMTFYPAVIVAAWFGGFGPCIAAIVASVTIAAYWLPPPDSFRVASPHDVAALMVFSAVGVLIATVIQTLRRTQMRLEVESNNRAALAAERAHLIDLEHRARTAAEAANRSKDEFLAMLGHELRTPLSAIATAAQALDHLHGRDQPTALPIAVITRQVRHVTRLVDDLLDAGRVMAGKIQIDRQPIDLSEIVERSIDALTAARKLEHHELALGLVPAWIDADADRMEQVIVNLVGNALKYTPAGGKIGIALERDQDAIVMKIEDDGIGISSELLPKVFDLFVQGTHGSNGSSGGLGIGLALVRRLVQLHGGTVEVSTRGPGRGTIFTVRLAAIDAPVREPGALAATR
jgi:signal transduction histidine kinase